MATALIDCRDIEVRHKSTTTLGPLSMRVDRGDFWGVVGPNGAGKSTLLRLLSGQIKASKGKIARAANNVGFLLQHHDYTELLPFRVRDVIAFGRVRPRSLGFNPDRDDLEAIDRAVRHLGLEGMQDQLYRRLSGGERRKVQFARLCAQNADLALLDEPTAGLDLDWQERVTQLAAQFFAKENSTIVMVTHDVDRLPACCNKALLLKDGRALAAGQPAEVFTPPILSELYGCTVEVVERTGRYHAFNSDRTEADAHLT